MVIIDTNILIDHLRQTSRPATIYAQLLKKYTKKHLAISSITVQELYIGQSTKNNHQHQALVKLLKELKIYSHTVSIAKLGGEITRDRKDQIKFADAAIAATAIHYNAHLATLNAKDFVGIPHLNLLTL